MKLQFLIQLLDVLDNFPVVRRDQWQARSPKEKIPIATPVPYVVIHHSYIPSACYNEGECGNAMREMQNIHMDHKEWSDIGYNFAIGSDGVAYEGRGWQLQGAHALHFNTISISICLIGDWRSNIPPATQINTTRALIASGVQAGVISPNYKLVGHNQVGSTECPGALSEEIRSWDHYSSFPSSQRDLLHVEELPDSVKQTIANATMAYKFYFQKVYAYI